MKVGVVMGSTSDWGVMSGATAILEQFGVEYEKKVLSAHRTPHQLEEWASGARERGVAAIIAGAGGAAHLAGVVAAFQTIGKFLSEHKTQIFTLISVIAKVVAAIGVVIAIVKTVITIFTIVKTVLTAVGAGARGGPPGWQGSQCVPSGKGQGAPWGLF